MTVERESLERVLKRIEKVEMELSGIKTHISNLLGETVFAPPTDLVRQLKLWKKIKDIGKEITKDQLYVIGHSLGYDPRGLNGFLHGPDSSLVKLANERIRLRDWASNEVDKYREWLDSQ